MMTAARIQRFLTRNTYVFALLLLFITLYVNRHYQENLFETDVLNRNLRVFIPLMILVVGQTIVVIGGGIDLSVGGQVALGNSLIAVALTRDSSTDEFYAAAVITVIVCMLAGVINGLCVSFLRLQPIVTTYATSFIFGGMALRLLPRPDGGTLPREVTRYYRSMPNEIPIFFYIAGALFLFWVILRLTRYGQSLYATGGNPQSAYATGIPVEWVKFSTYVLSGLFAGLASVAVSLETGSGASDIRNLMTLESIVAVVLGGTALSGGRGGVLGSLIAVVILGSFRNIISFAEVPHYYQSLVDALIIVAALAIPGVILLIQQATNSTTVKRLWQRQPA